MSPPTTPAPTPKSTGPSGTAVTPSAAKAFPLGEPIRDLAARVRELSNTVETLANRLEQLENHKGPLAPRFPKWFVRTPSNSSAEPNSPAETKERPNPTPEQTKSPRKRSPPNELPGLSADDILEEGLVLAQLMELRHRNALLTRHRSLLWAAILLVTSLIIGMVTWIFVIPSGWKALILKKLFVDVWTV
jgi:hypothetical protein